MSLFKENWFSHQTTKSVIAVFGSLFDQMSIVKKNADGTENQNYMVPITYAPKNKWVSMINERPDYSTNQVQMTLPRMAFEIVSFYPDPNRNMGFMRDFVVGNLNTGGKTKIMTPAPVTLTMNLYLMTKDAEDTFQVIEQIVPYFRPTLIVNFNLLPEFNIYKDIPISLLGVNTVDNYAGTTEDMRTLETTFQFSIPIYYFGPIAEKGNIIKQVKVTYSTDEGTVASYTAAINPPTANPGGTYTVVEKLTETP